MDGNKHVRNDAQLEELRSKLKLARENWGDLR